MSFAIISKISPIGLRMGKLHYNECMVKTISGHCCLYNHSISRRNTENPHQVDAVID